MINYLRLKLLLFLICFSSWSMIEKNYTKTTGEEFLEACLQLNAEKMQQLIDFCLDQECIDNLINFVDESKKGALHHLSDISSEFLFKKYSLEEKNKKLMETLSILALNGADINKKDDMGLTPLIGACKKSGFMVEHFLNHFFYSIDLKITDNEDHSALYYALIENKFGIAKLLLDHIESKDDEQTWQIYKTIFESGNGIDRYSLAQLYIDSGFIDIPESVDINIFRSLYKYITNDIKSRLYVLPPSIQNELINSNSNFYKVKNHLYKKLLEMGTIRAPNNLDMETILEYIKDQTKINTDNLNFIINNNNFTETMEAAIKYKNQFVYERLIEIIKSDNNDNRQVATLNILNQYDFDGKYLEIFLDKLLDDLNKNFIWDDERINISENSIFWSKLIDKLEIKDIRDLGSRQDLNKSILNKIINSCKRKYSSKRCENVYDNIMVDLVNENYYDVITFIISNIKNIEYDHLLITAIQFNNKYLLLYLLKNIDESYLYDDDISKMPISSALKLSDKTCANILFDKMAKKIDTDKEFQFNLLSECIRSHENIDAINFIIDHFKGPIEYRIFFNHNLYGLNGIEKFLNDRLTKEIVMKECGFKITILDHLKLCIQYLKDEGKDYLFLSEKIKSFEEEGNKSALTEEIAKIYYLNLSHPITDNTKYYQKLPKPVLYKLLHQMIISKFLFEPFYIFEKLLEILKTMPVDDHDIIIFLALIDDCGVNSFVSEISHEKKIKNFFENFKEKYRNLDVFKEIEWRDNKYSIISLCLEKYKTDFISNEIFQMFLTSCNIENKDDELLNKSIVEFERTKNDLMRLLMIGVLNSKKPIKRKAPFEEQEIKKITKYE